MIIISLLQCVQFSIGVLGCCIHYLIHVSLTKVKVYVYSRYVIKVSGKKDITPQLSLA